MHSRWLREFSTTQTVLITPRLVSEVNLSAAAICPCLNYFTALEEFVIMGDRDFLTLKQILKFWNCDRPANYIFLKRKKCL
jgi:hypothetical protein